MSDINSGEIANRELVVGLLCSEFGFKHDVMIPELNMSVDCYRARDRTIVHVVDPGMLFRLPYETLDKQCRRSRYRMFVVRIIAASGAAISKKYLQGYGLKTVDLPIIMSEDTITAYRNYLADYLSSNV